MCCLGSLLGRKVGIHHSALRFIKGVVKRAPLPKRLVNVWCWLSESNPELTEQKPTGLSLGSCFLPILINMQACIWQSTSKISLNGTMSILDIVTRRVVSGLDFKLTSQNGSSGFMARYSGGVTGLGAPSSKGVRLQNRASIVELIRPQVAHGLHLEY